MTAADPDEAVVLAVVSLENHPLEGAGMDGWMDGWSVHGYPGLDRWLMYVCTDILW